MASTVIPIDLEEAVEDRAHARLLVDLLRAASDKTRAAHVLVDELIDLEETRRPIGDEAKKSKLERELLRIRHLLFAVADEASDPLHDAQAIAVELFDSAQHRLQEDRVAS